MENLVHVLINLMLRYLFQRFGVVLIVNSCEKIISKKVQAFALATNQTLRGS